MHRFDPIFSRTSTRTFRTGPIMNKTQARRIHAHFEASTRIAVILPPSLLALALALGLPLADAMAVFAASLAFVATMAAVSTDMMSRRIPNSLSLVALAAGPAWWGAAGLGSQLPDLSGDGLVWSILAPIYGLEGQGALLPAFSNIAYPVRIGLDLAMLGVVFVPLYLSFRLGLGFGGGDVKLMAGLSLFFGWPLGLDFFFLTFLVGGLFSIGVITGRIFAKTAIRFGRTGDAVMRWSRLREFPFAPPIAIAAIACLAIKLQGLN